MAKYKVSTPVAGFTGTSAGTHFHDGHAVVDEGPALRYFRSAGYNVEAIEEPATADQTSVAEVESEAEAEGEALEGEPPADALPKKSASTETWREYATAHGMDADEADQLSRDQLVERFTNTEEEQQL